jgi:ParB/RepB/Spo0J family partition protein
MNAGTDIYGMLDMVTSDGATPTLLPITDIGPDPEQPRRTFDVVELENLAEAIREVGVLSPITISPNAPGAVPPWKIVDGERRWRASQIAGKEDIPVKVRVDLDDSHKDRPLAQLIANANRSDLTDYELALAVRKQLAEWGNKRGDKGRIAKLINRPQAVVSRLLAMLDDGMEPLVQEGLITSAEAVASFRALGNNVQAEVLDHARASGEPITVTGIRDKLATIAALAAPAPSSADASMPADPLGDSANTHAVETQPTGDDAFPAGSMGNDREANDDVHQHDAARDADDEGLDAESRDDNEFSDDSHPGHTLGDSSSASTSTKPATAGGAREKSVSLQLTGEGVEDLLRYLVDKSSDRVELRLNADLARGVIENLGGEVPERSDTYADLIKDLLESKTGR